MPMTLSHRPGSPAVFTPGPEFPIDRNIWTFSWSIRRSYTVQRVLLPSLSCGRPPMLMLMTSAFACLAT